MRIRCQRNMLAAGFQAVGGVVPSRTPKDVLKNVKLHVADKQATLIATDQEVGIRYELPEVETESAGEVLLPTQRLSAILREVPDDVVSIEVDEEALWIRCTHSEFRLSITDPLEFPDVPTFSGDDYYQLSAGAFRQAIQRTIFATDVESTRYALGGILLDFAEDRVTLAATDSRRLAVCSTNCTSEGNPGQSDVAPVVPSKALSVIEKSLADDEADVQICVQSNDVIVRSGQATVYGRLVQGRFPKYQDVIPREFNINIEMVAGPLHSVVRQAMIVTNEESRGVDFSFGDGTLTLSSKAADVGTSRIDMPVSYDGDKVVITFDPRFVSEFLRVLEPSAQVILHLIDGNSAAVFQAEENYRYVVMPLAPEAP
ncbi:MAG: DNA polymerase III subunit beta [Planctomycetota bacterium]|nr:MAG: DNA polymerase III subunit beta [Planctomycetota bacterium]REJ95723.1 MAG: DNA polymerase III subunit beta [Planctomycetota bacterium]REK23405.1 MAG: DNA polymerase III subunit beta [Planctomycetota bacterium]REK38958.1 MAG: DNA polymerase III subunit beta [Planctomycetota bacterium]